MHLFVVILGVQSESNRSSFCSLKIACAVSAPSSKTCSVPLTLPLTLKMAPTRRKKHCATVDDIMKLGHELLSGVPIAKLSNDFTFHLSDDTNRRQGTKMLKGEPVVSIKGNTKGLHKVKDQELKEKILPTLISVRIIGWCVVGSALQVLPRTIALWPSNSETLLAEKREMHTKATFCRSWHTGFGE